jgi:hypothetical protein
MVAAMLARPVRSTIIVVAVLLAAGALWLWSRAGSSTPVSEESALQTLRAAGGAERAGGAGVPRPGVYSYRQEGSERGGAGPLKVSRELPATARLVVTPAAGGYGRELDLSEEHIEGVRLRVGPTGTHEVSRRTKVTFVGVGRDDRRTLHPQPLALPRALSPGRTWSGSYSAGGLPVTYRSTVLRAERVRVGDADLPALVVRSVARTGGPHPGDRTDVIWWSSALSLPLRWDIDTRIGGTFSLNTRARLDLESTTPAR